MEEMNIEIFDLEAEILCLDFANTSDWHASENPIEMLTSYASLVSFSLQTGVLTDMEARNLLRLAAEQPDQAQASLGDAITLREAIFRIFSAGSGGVLGQQLAQEDLDILTRFWQEAVQARRFVERAGAVRLEWEFKLDDLRCMLWPITQSAVDLLVDGSSARVGMCEDDRGCGFLFLDTSRNHSRRWCSMESCGNRAKALRHYSRSKQ
jgi:predicted RNA-binding Zn ribbon-like protein